MPSPDDTFFTQRRSLDRNSSRLKRASRRLAKKGFRGEAGKMAAAAEMARLQEPSIMRPEFRELDQAARDIQALQAQATAGGLDFERDIAPLRGQFFGSLGSSGLSSSEQQMLVDKYASGFTGDALAAEELQAKRAERDMRTRASEQAFQAASEKLSAFRRDIGKDREVEDMLGGLSGRIGNIMTGPESREVKLQKIGILSRDPQVAALMDRPRIASMVGSARAELTGERQYEDAAKRADRSFGLQAAQVLSDLSTEDQGKLIDDLGLHSQSALIAKQAASYFAADRRTSATKAEREFNLQRYNLRIKRISDARERLQSLEKNFVASEDDTIGSDLFGGKTKKTDPATIAGNILSLLAIVAPERVLKDDPAIENLKKIIEDRKTYTWSKGNVLAPLQDAAALVRFYLDRETNILGSIVEDSTGNTQAPARNPAFSLGNP